MLKNNNAQQEQEVPNALNNSNQAMVTESNSQQDVESVISTDEIFLQFGRNEEGDIISLPETTKLDESIYELLPQRLAGLCENFVSRERDIVLLSVLTSISAVLPNITIYYGKQYYWANLNLFISAPPASGKGVMSHALNTISSIDEYISSQGKELIIPGNSSHASMIDLLNKSEHGCLIHETEADSLSNVLTKEWGGFSDTLRKVFHHETVQVARKTDKVYIKCKEPRLSMCISGTEDQLTPFVKSIDNGLFSRMMYYYFDEVASWENQFTEEEDEGKVDSFKEDIIKMDAYTVELYKILEKEEYILKLTALQKQKLNNVLSRCHEFIKECNIGLLSVVKRLGIMVCRLIVILECLENLPKLSESKHEGNVNTIYASENSFVIALKMLPCLLGNAVKISDVMIDKVTLPSRLDEFLKNLPSKFTTAEIKAMNIFGSNSTIDKNIRFLVEQGKLIKVEHGRYKNPNSCSRFHDRLR